MAKCKLCKTNIPDGAEYCDDCQDKGNQLSKESYLDSLLNSVKNSAPMAEDLYKKKNHADIKSSVDTDSDLEEFASQDYDIYGVDMGEVEEFGQFNLEEELKNIDNDFLIEDEDLFGDDLSKLLANDNETESKEKQTSSNNVNPSEINDFQEEDEIDADLNNLLKSLEYNEDMDEEDHSNEEIHMSDDHKIIDDYMMEEDKSIDSFLEDQIMSDGSDNDSQDEIDDDFLSLLGQISSDDPVAEDVMAIKSILSGEPVEPQRNSAPTDVGDVFSDALKVVTSLNDPKADEYDLLNNAENKAPKSKKIKRVKEKKNKVEEDLGDKSQSSLFQRLFSNVKDENTKKKAQALKKEAEIAAAKDAAETEKSKKGNRGKGSNVNNDEESSEDIKTAKDKAAAKREKRADKKEKKKKTKEVIQVIDEIEEDEGRINRLGATIVFLFFGLAVMLLIIGTNTISYTLSIQSATNYFNKKKYTEAYNEVYGMDIKDEDIEIYDKIQTVMFVNKQLNSYNNYYSLGKYPEALDSLLKGLKRYDKYIELATLLGIESDLDYVRNQILAELNNVYTLSDEEAMKLNDMKSTKEYSLQVYDIVAERVNN